ncbi:unnamed protein product [Urochloa humidicola]
MAPSREACAVAMAMAAPFLAMASNISSATATAAGGNGSEKRRRTSSDTLQRTVSDVSYELHHHEHSSKDKTTKEAEEFQAIISPRWRKPSASAAACRRSARLSTSAAYAAGS